MKLFSKNFIQGIGSVLEISPNTEYEVQMPFFEKSIEETLMDDWGKVNQYLCAGVSQYGESLETDQ